MNLWPDNLPTLDSRRLYLPSFSELGILIKDFTVGEIFTLVGLVLWLIILAMPLKGIDRRDNITGVTYLVYLGFGGIALVLAVPGKLTAFSDGVWHLLAMTTFAGLGAIKWWFRGPPPIVIRTVEENTSGPPMENDK